MQRFQADIEIWTQSAKIELGKTKPTFRANVALMDGSDLAKKVATLRNPAKTLRPMKRMGDDDHEGDAWEAYGDSLSAYAGNISGLMRMGALHTVDQGTHYHLDTFAYAAEPDLLALDPAMRLMVNSPAGEFAFHSFSTRTSKGSDLADNCVLQSRLSRVTGRWSTAILT